MTKAVSRARLAAVFAARHRHPLAACVLGLALLMPSVASSAVWTQVGSVSLGRGGHAATLLPNGHVLMTGGFCCGGAIPPLTEVATYDPATGLWATGSPMAIGRSGHTATLLPNGKLLVAGGYSAGTVAASSEILDLATGVWTSAGALPGGARTRHTATLLQSGKLLVAGGLDASSTAVATAVLYDPASGTWTTTGSLAAARSSHNTVLLQTGKVLVAGGDSSAEIYNPATGTWTATAAMSAPRGGATATLLPSGKVLVAGGGTTSTLTSAEIFDPAANAGAGGWVATGSMSTGHNGARAVLLPSGKVLVLGGTSAGFSALNAAEVFDPAGNGGVGSFSATASLIAGRYNHTATLLPDGRVLAVAGSGDVNDLASSELFDPQTGGWSASTALPAPRNAHSATLLPSGQILIAAGVDASFAAVASSLRYDPTTGTSTATGSLTTARRDHSATLLTSGRVLVAGGFTSVRLSSAELYNPSAGTWTSAGSFTTARSAHTTTLLPDGHVLLAGGTGDGLGGLGGAQLYDPVANTWAATTSLGSPRAYHTATRLRDGRVLVAGGYNANGTIAGAEIYDSTRGTWTPTGSLKGARMYHTTTLLPDGTVLVAGGYDGDAAIASCEIYDPTTGAWRATGSLGVVRMEHAAALLMDGEVLVSGGEDTLGNYPSATEIYSPATGKWRTAGALSGARYGHSMTVTPAGKLLVAGGYNSGSGVIGTAEVFDRAEFPDSRRPVITGSSANVTYGTTLTLTGTAFRGDSEAADGEGSSSSVKYPLVQARAIEGDRATWLAPDARANFSDDPMTLSFGSLPNGLDAGWYRLTVVTAGVPSASRLVEVKCSVAITQQPSNLTVALGTSATFNVAAQGARTFQWRKDNMDIPGADAASYTTPPVTGADSGSTYDVVVTGACPTAQATSNAATLTVQDSTPPSVSIASPAGGEYWILSGSAASPNTQLVGWTMSDNVRVCQLTASLLYSNDGGATYQAAAAGGGLPYTVGPGGLCANPGVTTSNFTYAVPTTFPSGVTGSLYKLQVTVTDEVGLQTTATSPNPFYIVQANPDSVRTLVLANLSRMQALGMSTSALSGKLVELANNPKVQGLIVDLGGVTSVQPLYAAWDATPANASLANDVLFAPGGIQDYLRSNILNNYTGIKYVILVGDDRIIPFARLADHTSLLDESTYANGSGLTATGTTVGQALAANKYLSDDPLVVQDQVQSNQLSGNLFIPDFAVGRLVETPQQIIQTIVTFISQDGILDLSSLDPTTGHKVLVTGYDFLTDAAKHVRERWKTALGACTTGCETDSAPVDGSLVSDSWGLGSVPFRIDALQTRFCGNGGARYALMSLSGHATHFEEGVPGTDPFDIQGFGTAAMTDPDACGAGQPLNLPGGVVYAVGCHGGLPVTGSNPADNPQDLPETLLSRGVVAYVANTGYGWGLRSGIGYGERLEELLTEELTRGGTLVVGDAVKRAKQRYYLETPRYDSYDEKSLMQWALFGLPMYGIKTGIPTGSRPSLVSGPPPTALERPAYERVGGVGIERAEASSSPQPAFLTQLSLHFDFTAPGLYTKWTAAGDPAPLVPGCSDLNGCYYTLNGLVERSSGDSDLPVQPYFIYDSRLSGTSQHGVLWKGGTYDEETGWVPVIAELVSNGGDGSDHGSAPRLMFTRPTSPRVVQGLDSATCRPSDLELNSLTVQAGEVLKNQDSDPSYSIERRYRTVDLEAFYFNDTADSTHNCDRNGPSLGVGPLAGGYHQALPGQLDWAVPATDASGVWRVIVVVNDNSLDGQGRGLWFPVELQDDGSGTWRGTQALGGGRATYVIEAVDNRGNVTWLDYVTAQLPASGVALGIPVARDVMVPPNPTPSITSFTPASGIVGSVITINGSNLLGATAVTFNGTAAVFNVQSSGRIAATVPAGATDGPISVTTPDGTAISAQSFKVTSAPSMRVSDARVREGNAGTRNMVFRVTLSAPSPQIVAVDYATADGTATTADNDYVQKSGTLSFAPYARSRTILVSVKGDTVVEGNQTLAVTLSNAQNALIARPSATGTIINDDH